MSAAAATPDVAADRDAIRHLFARYVRAVDDGAERADEFAGYYAEDGRFEQAGMEPIVGRAALRAFAATLPTSGIRHLVSDHVIEVDGDEASCDASVVVIAAGRIVSTGRARDVLRRVDGGWQIISRSFAADPK